MLRLVAFIFHFSSQHSLVARREIAVAERHFTSTASTLRKRLLRCWILVYAWNASPGGLLQTELKKKTKLEANLKPELQGIFFLKTLISG